MRDYSGGQTPRTVKPPTSSVGSIHARDQTNWTWWDLGSIRNRSTHPSCGRSTKITAELLRKPKSYFAVIRFKTPVPEDKLKSLVNTMKGEIFNVPPKESAVKYKSGQGRFLNLDWSRQKREIGCTCSRSAARLEPTSGPW